ncbi:hypothetical protein LXL04_000968 [Taraxacum kok-saghyz]
MRQETKSLAIYATFILLFLSLELNEASRIYNGEVAEAWMKTESLLLSALPKGPVRPPGNGCNWTGNGGNPCIGSRKLVTRHGGVEAASPQ